ncbi:MAG: bifunctional adenosylcobinamide kinase/adenosylcobinamide-phosphate guanylyltransferase [Thermodesulfovibrionales bacterium]|nr:bifunctional adenosylcobinamide kinase/adenosylcobinamide-phosphate guanylyltransferase [Thermodesulfovibrionales bacterium]
MVTLIIGGARSGKSSFALAEASMLAGRKAYIATCEPLDEEMRQRIKRHRAERPEGWDTFEEPLEIVPLLGQLSKSHGVIVIDCLTLWLSNLMHGGRNVVEEMDAFVSALPAAGLSSGIYIVSNEVGMGIVPDNETARRFRDLAGTLNRRAAEAAGMVYMTVAGMPVKIKGG